MATNARMVAGLVSVCDLALAVPAVQQSAIGQLSGKAQKQAKKSVKKAWKWRWQLRPGKTRNW